MASMVRAAPLHVSPDVSITETRCEDVATRVADEELIPGFSVVFVCSGQFRRRVDGDDSLLDPTMAYVDRQGAIQQVDHPSGGDTCTNVVLSAALLGSMADPDAVPTSPVHVMSDLSLLHWRLVSRARRGADAFELAERALIIVGRLVRGFGDQLSGRLTGPSTSPRRRRLVDNVRDAIGDRPDQGLGDLAAMFSVDGFQLSRAFRAETGLTLTDYRRRLRIGLVMERLSRGETSLALLAADAGFADQSHMTRTLRREVDLTPGQLRRILAAAG